MLRTTLGTARTLAVTALVAASFATPSVAQQAGPVGDWEGTLSAGGQTFPLVLHVTEAEDGSLDATIDSPSQAALGIPSSSVSFEEGTLVVELTDIAANYTADLSEDGESLTGTWSQGGGNFELVMTRSEG